MDGAVKCRTVKRKMRVTGVARRAAAFVKTQRAGWVTTRTRPLDWRMKKKRAEPTQLLEMRGQPEVTTRAPPSSTSKATGKALKSATPRHLLFVSLSSPPSPSSLLYPRS